MPFKCPICGHEGLLPTPPPKEHELVRQDLDEAAAQAKKASRERKRWRRVRLGLTILCGGSWVTLVAATIGLFCYLLAWFGSMLGWTDVPTGPALLSVMGIVFGLIDLGALAGYFYIWRGPRSARLKSWVLAHLAVALPRNLGCFGTSLAILLLGLAPGTLGWRLVVGATGVLFLVQWVVHMLFLREVAHAQCAAWLMRHIHNWLCLLLGTCVVGAIMLACWPTTGAPPANGTEWINAVYLGVVGLLTAALSWACFLYYVWILLLVRSVAQA
jgi:hypothetical protein